MEKRGCGMLLPVASLPSKYGIGAFSKEAYEFVDKLVKAGQQYWQILPLGPTGYGDSPYQAFGAFAGNPYFIDLEQLIEAGLLTEEECQMADFGSDDRDIDYGKIYENRFPLLKKAFLRWEEQQKKAGLDEKEIRKYLKKQLRAETRDYCFYMALKNQFGGKSFSEWDKDIRTREDDALKHYKKELREEIAFYEFQQMIFEKQWKALKTYANERGIRIIGDIPIYVASDSADSWAHPELFQFDEDCRPTAVAGCPPDAFSATGQLFLCSFYFIYFDFLILFWALFLYSVFHLMLTFSLNLFPAHLPAYPPAHGCTAPPSVCTVQESPPSDLPSSFSNASSFRVWTAH